MTNKNKLRILLIAASLLFILSMDVLTANAETETGTGKDFAVTEYNLIPEKENAAESLTDAITEENGNGGVFTVTAYCPCEACCVEFANGITASGVPAEEGITVAVDPELIPFGTEIELGGHTYTAQDAGCAIVGNRIDIFFNDHEDALAWGVREMTARW